MISEDYIILHNTVLETNDDPRATTRLMPRKAIDMLDTLVEAILSGDEELYLSVMHSNTHIDRDYYEYLAKLFEDGRNYKLTDITPMAADVDRLQNGGYYVGVGITDETGNGSGIGAVGITKDANGEWIVYYFD